MTTFLEVVKINRPESEDNEVIEEPRRPDNNNNDNSKETIDAVNNNGGTRQLEVLEIKRPSAFVPNSQEPSIISENMMCHFFTPNPLEKS